MEGRTWNVFVVEADSPVRKSLKLALEPELSELSERRFGYEAERRSHFVADAGLLRTAILLISRKSSQGWERWICLDAGLFGPRQPSSAPG
jgi:hypothetical protein